MINILKILGGYGPFVPPGYAYALTPPRKFSAYANATEN